MICAGLIFTTVSAHPLLATEKTIQVQVTPIPLDPLHPADKEFGELTYVGGAVLSSDAPEFGGLSGLIISSDGTHLTAVSDKGYWLTANILSDGEVLKGLADVRISPLLTPTKLPVQNNWSDAEGLTRAPSGQLIVSFERHHRIWSYDVKSKGFQALPKPVRLPPSVKSIRFNKGLESITYLDDGRLMMLTEHSFDAQSRLLGWLSTDQGFKEIYVAPSGLFHITDMARLPDGDILLLERRYTIIGGPGMQIRRIAKQDIQPGNVLDGPILIELSSRFNIDNMEGLAIRSTPGGGVYLYVISDDNFSDVQRTVLFIFKLYI